MSMVSAGPQKVCKLEAQFIWRLQIKPTNFAHCLSLLALLSLNACGIYEEGSPVTTFKEQSQALIPCREYWDPPCPDEYVCVQYTCRRLCNDTPGEPRCLGQYDGCCPEGYCHPSCK